MHIDEQVSFRKLEIFLSFLELGNMTRVSEALDLSVVSVHRALHSLEEGLRCPLFRRDGRKLIPLASAYVFAEDAERALRACASGIEKARQAAGVGGARLKVGALYSLTLNTIPRLLMGVKTRRPELDVDLTLGSNRDLLRKLSDGELDAIVIALHERDTPSDLQPVPVFDDDIWFAAPPGSPYAQHREIDLLGLRDADFVSLNDDFATYQDFTHAFDVAGFQPRIAMRVGDIFSLINLVSGGMGYALLPGRIAEFSPQIQLIPLARRYATSQRITLLFARNRERDPNLLALSAECRVFKRHDVK
ncbi:LysR family transcriptional regulator [Bordetella genomosp. 8]|uniref:LysR family transcriptional regulator n=1 Tax=Bordetella genomosp. 8 TaxID=1416806 RepID=A0A1W6YVI1_9BORD|nr:LysR family transcriptional regulator [Bordetella genomosp. 8]ARP84623.1 LysR family transcriptional regulator [Bordetella genomosp. 8]